MKSHACLAALLLTFFVAPLSAFADRGNVVAGDYDGDGRTDIVVARKLGGAWVWFVRFATGADSGPISFGLATDAAADSLIAGDYDGDGDFELGVARNVGGFLNWYSRQDDGTAAESLWGLAGDTPLTGYFGGSGENDRVAVRPVGGGLIWYIQGAAEAGVAWGLAGDTPYAADLNGDGVDELVVARTEAGVINWYARDLNGSFVKTISWGLAGDRLLPPSDFNGDGKADIVVTRNFGAFQVVFINYTDLNLGQDVLFGLSGDTPYIGFFTQSTLAELAMFRQAPGFGTHFVRFALVDFAAEVSFGLTGDTLVQPEGRGAVSTSINGCTPTPGTDTDFIDGGGRGDLWKPVSEGVRNGAPVVLLPLRYCGAQLTIFGSNGLPVSGVQRTKCGGNGDRAHFWIELTAGQLQPFAPLVVRVQDGPVTECRVVPNPRQRYD